MPSFTLTYEIARYYACQIWGQIQCKTINIIQCAQNKALRMISFKQFMEPSDPLYI